MPNLDPATAQAIATARLARIENAKASLEVFKALNPNPDGDKKLIYSATQQRFTGISTSSIGRTFTNWGRAKGTENSIENDAFFKTPILKVFDELIGHLDSVTMKDLKLGLEGLNQLARSYNGDNAKKAKLADIINTVNNHILSYENDLSTAKDQHYYSNIINKAIGSAEVQLIHHSDKMILKTIFNISNDKDRTLYKKLQDFIGTTENITSLDTSQEITYRIRLQLPAENEKCVGEISDLVYKQLQFIKAAKVSTPFENWCNSIYKAMYNADGKDFTGHTYFHNNPRLSIVTWDLRNFKFIEVPSDSLPQDDFLWFAKAGSSGGANYRLYLHPRDMSQIDKFIRAVKAIWQSGVDGVSNISFKIDWKKDMTFKRRDLIIMYIQGNQNQWRNLATRIKTELNDPSYLKAGMSVIDAKEHNDTNDIHMSMEPGLISLGISSKDIGGSIQTQHSASMFRAQLITMALLQWKLTFHSQRYDKSDDETAYYKSYSFITFMYFYVEALKGYRTHLDGMNWEIPGAPVI
jgi:hypothetical protein